MIVVQPQRCAAELGHHPVPERVGGERLVQGEVLKGCLGVGVGTTGAEGIEPLR